MFVILVNSVGILLDVLVMFFVFYYRCFSQKTTTL